jgi:hypothetical protein
MQFIRLVIELYCARLLADWTTPQIVGAAYWAIFQAYAHVFEIYKRRRNPPQFEDVWRIRDDSERRRRREIYYVIWREEHCLTKWRLLHQVSVEDADCFTP